MESQKAPDPAGALDDDRFLVRSRVEIAFILRAIMHSGEIVTAHFGEGADFVITAILRVDAEAGYAILDAGKDAATNRRVVASRRVSFVTRQDKVKVQFQATDVRAIEFEGKPAFRIPLPEALLKFQRREYHRVETPVVRPVLCMIPRPDAPALATTLVDISLGGVCLTGYPADTRLEPGQEFDGCRIELPEAGVLVTRLQVRNAFEVPLRNGSVSRRAGCMFVGLSPASEAMLQRYIIRLERDRRARRASGSL
jgi:c-di-GMP-binding flagellar brake protein YcgR